VERPTPDIRAIFDQAVEIDSADERAAFLDRVCSGYPEARRRLDELLRAYAGAGSFLDTPAPGLPATIDHPSAGEAGAVGAYRLVQPIGEGGMGTVYLAEQTEPVQRRVAVKILKPGLHSQHLLARLEAERQALALMDHPNIAKVLDAGTTDGDRPYFVMELVPGIPITHYCDQHRLTPRQRLELFLPVCRAVQHAHQKGVIHRDLKPSNVLIAPYDGKPVPKVIDFGIAKAVGQKLTGRTLVTEFGQVIGTPEYMSPEQAGTDEFDVDTRSDVYALGVLLYELLTGTTPLERTRARGVGLLEVLRLVREEEPPRPSARLAATDSASVAAKRGLDPRRLCATVRGDLDWIVMKCLEKDRTHRYETANGLAQDLERYLADEPVAACPPSALYRARKFVRRNRGPVLAAGLVLICLVGGVVASTIGFLRALDAEGQVSHNLRDLQIAHAETKKALGDSERARHLMTEAEADTHAFSVFLVNQVLSAGRPEGLQLGLGVNTTLAEALDASEGKIDEVFAGRPKAEATARHAIGVTWRNLGQYARARAHLRRALALRERELGARADETLDTRNSLAVALMALGQYDAAIPLLEQNVALRSESLGPDHPVTLLETSNLAEAYRDAGRLHEAVPLMERTLTTIQAKLPAGSRQLLVCMDNLASAYRYAGRHDDAIRLHERARQLMEEHLGPEDPDTLACAANLATAYSETNRPQLALPIFARVIELSKSKLGRDHPGTLLAMSGLAFTQRDLGNRHEALSLFKQVRELREAKLGRQHPATLKSMHDVACAVRDVGRVPEALTLFEETLDACRKALPPDHPQTLSTINNLGVLCWSTRRLNRSVPLFEELVERQKAKHGPGHPETLRAMANLGVNYCYASRLPDGVARLEEAFLRIRALPLKEQTALVWVRGALADAYDRSGQYGKSEPLYRETLDQARREWGERDPRSAGILATLGLNLLRQQKHADAERVLSECLAIREKATPDDWVAFNTRSMLGEALLGQKKYGDAEPRLLQGYAGMTQREDKIPAEGKVRLSEALERLVRLYDEWDKPDQAAEWRKKLEERQKPKDQPEPDR
jgi:serine/threonine protein kinase/tetratricopeptide (TPR) repeat protein